MRGKTDFTVHELAPNARLVSTRDFGDILFGCPSNVIKSIIEKKRFPDYCVVTLRTLRQGHNFLDVEFLYYATAFFRQGQNKLRIVCMPSQRKRILAMLKESLFGPSFLQMMLALVPSGVLKTPLPKGLAQDREDTPRGRAMARLLKRISRTKGLEAAFETCMRSHLSAASRIRKLAKYFAGLREITPGRHASFARYWVHARIIQRECSYFGAYPDDISDAVSEYVEFILFDEKNRAVIRNGRKRFVIEQKTACLFDLLRRGASQCHVDLRESEQTCITVPFRKTPFTRPGLGVTFIGSGTGFSTDKLTTCNIAWAGGVGIGVDLVAESAAYLRRLGIPRGDVRHVILTHTHSDHDAGLIQRILADEKIHVLTSRIIFDSFLRKAEAITCMPREDFKKLVDFIELAPGKDRAIPGVPHTSVRFDYSFHPIPAGRVVISYHKPGGVKMRLAFSGDTLFDPRKIEFLFKQGLLAPERRNTLLDFLWEADLVVHEAGGDEIHTDPDVLAKLPPALKRKTWINHTALEKGTYKGLHVAREGRTVVLIKGKSPLVKSRRDIETLQRTALFEHFSVRELAEILNQGKIVRKRAGSDIVREGDHGNEFYIVLAGMAVVKKDGAPVNEYECGDFFGELAILSGDHCRKATVTAQTNMRLLVLPGALYRKYRLPEAMEENLYNLMTFFSDRTTSHLLGALACGELLYFTRGEDIIFLGAKDRTTYVLLSGQVEVLDAADQELKILKDVDVFGEIASIDKVRRTATVRAQSNVRVLKLQESQLRELMEKFPTFYATLMQKKRTRLRQPGKLDQILSDHFGFR